MRNFRRRRKGAGGQADVSLCASEERGRRGRHRPAIKDSMLREHALEVQQQQQQRRQSDSTGVNSGNGNTLASGPIYHVMSQALQRELIQFRSVQSNLDLQLGESGRSS